MPPINYDDYHSTLPDEKRPQREPLRSEVPLAVLAGVSAASASLFGKLAVEERTAEVADTAYFIICKLDLDLLLNKEQTLWLVRALLIGAMLASNAAMWAFFTKSLGRTQSSARVTVINSCANFCFTALFGYLFFDEPLALRWWLGAMLMVAGGVLVAAPGPVADPTAKHTAVKSSSSKTGTTTAHAASATGKARYRAAHGNE